MELLTIISLSILLGIGILFLSTHIVTMIITYKFKYGEYIRDIKLLLSLRKFNLSYKSEKKHPYLGYSRSYFDIESGEMKQLIMYDYTNSIYVNTYNGELKKFEILKSVDLVLLISIYILKKRIKDIEPKKMEWEEIQDLVVAKMMESKRVKKIKDILS